MESHAPFSTCHFKSTQVSKKARVYIPSEKKVSSIAENDVRISYETACSNEFMPWFPLWNHFPPSTGPGQPPFAHSYGLSPIEAQIRASRRRRQSLPDENTKDSRTDSPMNSPPSLSQIRSTPRDHGDTWASSRGLGIIIEGHPSSDIMEPDTDTPPSFWRPNMRRTGDSRRRASNELSEPNSSPFPCAYRSLDSPLGAGGSQDPPSDGSMGSGSGSGGKGVFAFLPPARGALLSEPMVRFIDVDPYGSPPRERMFRASGERKETIDSAIEQLKPVFFLNSRPVENSPSSSSMWPLFIPSSTRRAPAD